MAIRLRTVNGVRVALCAAKSNPEPGDMYLDDADHYAITAKYAKEWQADMGFSAPWAEWPLMEQEETKV